MFIIVIPGLRYYGSTNVVVNRYEDSEVGESEGEEEGSEEEVPSDEEEEEEEPAEEQGKCVSILYLSLSLDLSPTYTWTHYSSETTS